MIITALIIVTKQILPYVAINMGIVKIHFSIFFDSTPIDGNTHL